VILIAWPNDFISTSEWHYLNPYVAFWPIWLPMACFGLLHLLGAITVSIGFLAGLNCVVLVLGWWVMVSEPPNSKL
jgi:hypothetical protein